MKSYIKAIIIFNQSGEKRIVPLKQGVNIITGESKTGKSALVEIIDYCLCSTRCTIPKGKITDFSYLYTLVMAIGNYTYVIARLNWESWIIFLIRQCYCIKTHNAKLNLRWVY